MVKSTRLVPKPGVGRADIERLADRSGWVHHRTTEAAAGNVPFEITWLSADRGAAVHWIEDELTPIHYLYVGGPDIEPTLDVLYANLDLYDDVSLAQQFNEAEDGLTRIDLLHVLGVHCSGSFDQRMFDLFRRGLADPEPLVRRVALLAAANADWPEFRPLMEHIRDHDPDPEVREDAAAMVEALSR